MRGWYEKHPGYAVASEKKRRESGATAVYERDRYSNNPEFRARKKARNMVLIRVARGTMERECCDVCGAPEAQAHHDDYSQPLNVRWLCDTHHQEIHRAF